MPHRQKSAGQVSAGFLATISQGPQQKPKVQLHIHVLNAGAASSISAPGFAGLLVVPIPQLLGPHHAGLFLSLRVEYDPANSSCTSLIMEYHMGFSDFSGTMTTDFTSTFSPVLNEANVCTGQCM